MEEIRRRVKFWNYHVLIITRTRRQLTLCKSSRAMTTDAAQKRVDSSSRGLLSIATTEQARHVSRTMPAWISSAQVHKTWGTEATVFICFNRFFSFNTCASFPSILIFCFENLFKLNSLSAKRREIFHSLTEYNH